MGSPSRCCQLDLLHKDGRKSRVLGRVNEHGRKYTGNSHYFNDGFWQDIRRFAQDEDKRKLTFLNGD